MADNEPINPDDAVKRTFDLMAENARLNQSAAEMLRPQLLKELRQLNITRVRCCYDGSGDSGQLDDPSFFCGDDEVAVRSTPNLITTREFNSWIGGVRQVVEKPTYLASGVLDFFYFHLELKHGGWEIDSGSEGEFDWDITNDKIAWQHRDRIESFEVTDEEL
jgi:hypothetical protein